MSNSSDGRSGQEKLDDGLALEAIIEERIGQETLDKEYLQLDHQLLPAIG